MVDPIINNNILDYNIDYARVLPYMAHVNCISVKECPSYNDIIDAFRLVLKFLPLRGT